DNGQVLRCDTRHEVLVVTEDGYSWKRFAELEADDRICLSMAQEIEFGSTKCLPTIRRANKQYVAPFGINSFGKEFFYWLGFYIGDGWISHSLEKHRWSLAYSFGATKVEERAEVTARADRCAAYFRSLGLNTNFRWQSSQKGELTIYSKGLIECLARIGINTNAKAKTKRVPSFIFGSPLLARKAFLRGVLDSDGFHGGNGAT